MLIQDEYLYYFKSNVWNFQLSNQNRAYVLSAVNRVLESIAEPNDLDEQQALLIINLATQEMTLAKVKKTIGKKNANWFTKLTIGFCSGGLCNTVHMVLTFCAKEVFKVVTKKKMMQYSKFFLIEFIPFLHIP